MRRPCGRSPLYFSDLTNYVGQRREIRGRVAQSHCGGTVADIPVGVPSMLYELRPGTPADEAILPGMKTPGAANSPSASTAIPIAARIRVTLRSDIDLLHCTVGATSVGELAAPVRIPDGVIGSGAAVGLVCAPPSRQGATRVNLEVYSVTVDGKTWLVSTVAEASDDSAGSGNILRAGTALVFGVNGSNPPVPAKQ